MDDQGSIFIPFEIRRAAKLKTGDKLFAFRDDKGITLMTQDQLKAKVHAELVDPDLSLADELIAERRAEALKDMDDWGVDETIQQIR